jgi:hypothetical protein
MVHTMYIPRMWTVVRRRRLYTLHLLDCGPGFIMQATPSEAQTVPVWQGEVVAAENFNSSSGGYVKFPDLMPFGDTVLTVKGEVYSVLGSIEECWQACFATPPCNVFVYCPEKVRRTALHCSWPTVKVARVCKGKDALGSSGPSTLTFTSDPSLRHAALHDMTSHTMAMLAGLAVPAGRVRQRHIRAAGRASRGV